MLFLESQPQRHPPSARWSRCSSWGLFAPFCCHCGGEDFIGQCSDSVRAVFR